MNLLEVVIFFFNINFIFWWVYISFILPCPILMLLCLFHAYAVFVEANSLGWGLLEAGHTLSICTAPSFQLTEVALACQRTFITKIWTFWMYVFLPCFTYKQHCISYRRRFWIPVFDSAWRWAPVWAKLSLALAHCLSLFCFFFQFHHATSAACCELCCLTNRTENALCKKRW